MPQVPRNPSHHPAPRDRHETKRRPAPDGRAPPTLSPPSLLPGRDGEGAFPSTAGTGDTVRQEHPGVLLVPVPLPLQPCTARPGGCSPQENTQPALGPRSPSAGLGQSCSGLWDSSMGTWREHRDGDGDGTSSLSRQLCSPACFQRGITQVHVELSPKGAGGPSPAGSFPSLSRALRLQAAEHPNKRNKSQAGKVLSGWKMSSWEGGGSASVEAFWSILPRVGGEAGHRDLPRQWDGSPWAPRPRPPPPTRAPPARASVLAVLRSFPAQPPLPPPRRGCPGAPGTASPGGPPGQSTGQGPPLRGRAGIRPRCSAPGLAGEPGRVLLRAGGSGASRVPGLGRRRSGCGGGEDGRAPPALPAP